MGVGGIADLEASVDGPWKTSEHPPEGTCSIWPFQFNVHHSPALPKPPVVTHVEERLPYVFQAPVFSREFALIVIDSFKFDFLGEVNPDRDARKADMMIQRGRGKGEVEGITHKVLSGMCRNSGNSRGPRDGTGTNKIRSAPAPAFPEIREN